MPVQVNMRIFSNPGIFPDASAHRSNCKHSPAMLASAMKSLIEEHDLPDFTTKEGLKECYLHMDPILPLLLGSETDSRDEHLSAAALLQLCLIASDDVLGDDLNSYSGDGYSLTDHIADGLRSPCELRILASLALLIRLLRNTHFDRMEELTFSVIPLIQRHIATSKQDDLILELALDTWTQWAALMCFEDDGGLTLINFMERLSMATKEACRRQVASHILKRLQHAACTTLVLIKEDAEDADPMRKFFMAALRYDSAGDRLAALRGLYYSFDRLADDDDTDGVYPISQMSAADYTCITGEDCFHGLEITQSDADHLSEMRAKFYSLMRTFCQCNSSSRDMHALGEALQGLLQADPRSVDFSPRSVQIFAGGAEPSAFELLFSSWTDTLSHCVTALRSCSPDARTGDHEFCRQAANILEMQAAIQRRNGHIAARLASKVVRKGDATALWYWYAVSHSTDQRDLHDVVETLAGNLHALDGSRRSSPITKTRLYQCLLARVALSALAGVLTDPQSRNIRTSQDWLNVTDLAPMASWAAEEYLARAPWDGQYVAAMNCVSVLVELLRRRPGSTTSPTATSANPFERRWRAATAVHSRIWNRPVSTHLHTVVTALYDQFATAVWANSTILDKHLTTTPPPDPDDEKNDLSRGDLYTGVRGFSRAQIAAWRALIDGEDATSPRASMVAWRDAPASLLEEVLQLNDVAPMRNCDNCGVRSAVLRRCAACRKARYCTRLCQGEHWREEHKWACPRTHA